MFAGGTLPRAVLRSAVFIVVATECLRFILKVHRLTGQGNLAVDLEPVLLMLRSRLEEGLVPLFRRAGHD